MSNTARNVRRRRMMENRPVCVQCGRMMSHRSYKSRGQGRKKYWTCRCGNVAKAGKADKRNQLAEITKTKAQLAELAEQWDAEQNQAKG